MFLHQIFYQGLKARIASWPTLMLGKEPQFYFDLLMLLSLRNVLWVLWNEGRGSVLFLSTVSNHFLCTCTDMFTADLFDILLPMLNIYQEFVRNHQYSLQILAHCKQNRDFDKLLKQYEAKPDCEERTLETFLTYPMFQVCLFVLLKILFGVTKKIYIFLSEICWQVVPSLKKKKGGGIMV